MKLDFIELGKLTISKTNMRYSRQAPDVADILPSVRKRGVLVPILVRPSAEPNSVTGELDGFEIVAGIRRYESARRVANERGGEADPLPCAILEHGDDADAIEASLIENIARLDPDEVKRWETFAKLVREGREVEDISMTFGIPEQGVRRILALGNLLPRIRGLYRDEKINAATVKHLTLASRKQQKAWLTLYDDPDSYTPTGAQLKEWLFGGASIKVEHALFDVEASKLAIVADLFGEDCYFADADAFWKQQFAVIDERREAYLDEGWNDVVIVPPEDYFRQYEHARASKRDGGRIYIAVRPNGEVAFHEGYVTSQEAKRLAKGEKIDTGPKAARPEVTSTMQTYIDLHRHAATRAALTGHPKVALRLMVAHAIAGSPLWKVRPEPQTCRNEAVRESVEVCRAETEFDAKRRAVLALLGLDPERPTMTRDDMTVSRDHVGIVPLFLRLLDLPDRAVMEVIVIVMGETLESGSAAVEAVGGEIGIDMARYWQADDAFFEVLRDKEILTRIVAEVAGEPVAEANAKEPGKTLKRIVRDHLDGANGRPRAEGWVPKWMAFPPAAYTERGGVGSVIAHAEVTAARADHDPKPSGPAPVLALPAPAKPKGRKRSEQQPERKAA
ncbi:MAG TPA: ParB N-terminal domain-containing protein [Sphingopyxis sp.]|nr:ParB N-terminal domain-containing protein [Sphingopyxis sp.]HMP43819.1 ParB N-terminal domain-containing protein [Sphingopyxis sp.]